MNSSQLIFLACVLVCSLLKGSTSQPIPYDSYEYYGPLPVVPVVVPVPVPPPFYGGYQQFFDGLKKKEARFEAKQPNH
ncbi:hypothetical protein GCK32_004702 [Trichostrongylus colubriformis]|uniref:Uncharacterized protein n=1 Tax=Trichostrongylus colubriformis TaxID=6319 RepID=A0AAN8IY18_TRICO